MEVLRERVGIMNELDQFVGNYFSKEWVMRSVLRMSDEDIEDMKKQIDQEEKSGELPDPDEEEEKVPQEAKPVPVQVVPDTPKKEEEPKEKKEKYTVSNEDELTEELTRYMARLNEQN